MAKAKRKSITSNVIDLNAVRVRRGKLPILAGNVISLSAHREWPAFAQMVAYFRYRISEVYPTKVKRAPPLDWVEIADEFTQKRAMEVSNAGQ